MGLPLWLGSSKNKDPGSAENTEPFGPVAKTVKFLDPQHTCQLHPVFQTIAPLLTFDIQGEGREEIERERERERERGESGWSKGEARKMFQ